MENYIFCAVCTLLTLEISASIESVFSQDSPQASNTESFTTVINGNNQMFAGVLVTHLEVPTVQTLENFVNKVKTNYKKIPSLSTYIKKTSLRR